MATTILLPPEWHSDVTGAQTGYGVIENFVNPLNALVDDDTFASTKETARNNIGAYGGFASPSNVPPGSSVKSVKAVVRFKAPSASLLLHAGFDYEPRVPSTFVKFTGPSVAATGVKLTHVWDLTGLQGWDTEALYHVVILPLYPQRFPLELYFVGIEATFSDPIQTFELDASLFNASSLVAGLTRAIPTEAALSVLSSLSATMQAQVALAASLLSSGALSGDLHQQFVIAIDAALQGNPTFLAQLLRAIDQDGFLLQDATLSGSLDRLVPLASLLTSGADLSANIDKALNLSAGLFDNALLQASLFKVYAPINRPKVSVTPNDNRLRARSPRDGDKVKPS